MGRPTAPVGGLEPLAPAMVDVENLRIANVAMQKAGIAVRVVELKSIPRDSIT